MRRTFSSYGPVSTASNYFVPRTELVERAVMQLVGENPEEGGHYFTVWGPRQTGKSWVTRQALFRLREDPRFHVAKVNLQVGDILGDPVRAANYIAKRVNEDTGLSLPPVSDDTEFQELFTSSHLDRPLILILDEFDSLEPQTIDSLVRAFRNLYITGLDSAKPRLLHGLCLIGVRAVLGLNNPKGSPFNVQRSLNIPNLTEAEVNEMLHWYERDSGQVVEQAVIDRLFYETQGQPGLVSWFAELLVDQRKDAPVLSMCDWDAVYAKATYVLPNNNILNIIAKAQEPECLPAVLDLFRTEEKTVFSFDNPALNRLYLNGVVTYETAEGGAYYAKFPCPFIQKRLFNRFSGDLFKDINPIVDHFDDLADAVTEDSLVLRNILKRYQVWLSRELKKDYLLKDAPRRADLRVYEAVWHFNLYSYLRNRFANYDIRIWPEFPTGNGKVDLLLSYKGMRYALELKSFQDATQYRKAIVQAARYGRSLGLDRVTLAFFIDAIDDANRQKLELDILDSGSGVTVETFFLVTG